MDGSCTIIEIHPSQLGQLELLMHSTNQLFQTEVENSIYSTAGHRVHLKKIMPDFAWLPLGMQIESAVAWLFYISKRNTVTEQLSFSISLEAINMAVQCGPATGQCLIAVELENGLRQMHIGTEDEEIMAHRASTGDAMPKRFGQPLSKYEMEITAITSRGLSTQIPELEEGEQFYFHYIVAENLCRQSVDYPGEMDNSTWFAVDQSKKQLEQRWSAES